MKWRGGARRGAAAAAVLTALAGGAVGLKVWDFDSSNSGTPGACAAVRRPPPSRPNPSVPFPAGNRPGARASPSHGGRTG